MSTSAYIIIQEEEREIILFRPQDGYHASAGADMIETIRATMTAGSPTPEDIAMLLLSQTYDHGENIYQLHTRMNHHAHFVYRILIKPPFWVESLFTVSKYPREIVFSVSEGYLSDKPHPMHGLIHYTRPDAIRFRGIDINEYVELVNQKRMEVNQAWFKVIQEAEEPASSYSDVFSEIPPLTFAGAGDFRVQRYVEDTKLSLQLALKYHADTGEQPPDVRHF